MKTSRYLRKEKELCDTKNRCCTKRKKDGRERERGREEKRKTETKKEKICFGIKFARTLVFILISLYYETLHVFVVFTKYLFTYLIP